MTERSLRLANDREAEATLFDAIIAMTANAMAGDRDRCLVVGMVDHVAKPIHVDQLFAVLRCWVEVPSREA